MHRSEVSCVMSKSGDGNSQFGTHWVFSPDLGVEKKIRKGETLDIGWRFGRLSSKSVKVPEKKRYKQCKCIVCGKEFSVVRCSRKNCGVYCSLKCNPNAGGARRGSGHSKSGWYKGIFCNSTWELAFVVWCLDNNTPIRRFDGKALTYLVNGETKNYHPDFVVGDIECVVEIKGYVTPKSIAKQDQNPHVLLLTKNELIHVFEYMKKYGNYVELFDGNPHSSKKNECKVCRKLCKRLLCSQHCSGLYVSKLNLARSSNG